MGNLNSPTSAKALPAEIYYYRRGLYKLLPLLLFALTGCGGSSKDETVSNPVTPSAPISGSGGPVASTAPVATILLYAPEGTAGGGDNMGSKQLYVGLADASGNVLNGRTAVWSSSDTSKIIVNQNGLTGRSSRGGSAFVKVVSEGFADSAAVSITVPVLQPLGNLPPPVIKLGPGLPRVKVGQSTVMWATLFGSSGSAVSGAVMSWTSNNTSVATVQWDGVYATVTGVKKGIARITITSNGTTSTALATVTE